MEHCVSFAISYCTIASLLQHQPDRPTPLPFVQGLVFSCIPVDWLRTVGTQTWLDPPCRDFRSIRLITTTYTVKVMLTYVAVVPSRFADAQYSSTSAFLWQVTTSIIQGYAHTVLYSIPNAPLFAHHACIIYFMRCRTSSRAPVQSNSVHHHCD